MSADLVHPKDVTLPILERYQRYLYHYRKPNGAPLTFGSQQSVAAPLKDVLPVGRARAASALQPGLRAAVAPPAAAPAAPHPLHRRHREHPQSAGPRDGELGVRDRAMLETLYSSGVRRMELVASESLRCRRCATAHSPCAQGKGGRDRVVPLGARASAWLERYLEEVRPAIVIEPR